MKKFSGIILFICIFSLIFTSIGWAGNMKGTLDVYDFEDCLNFYLNGEKFDGSYFVKNGTTYMQLRDLGDVLGIELKWDQFAKKVSFSVGDKEVNLWIDKTTANIGNNKVKLPSAPCVVKGRTYLPLRFVSELLGLKVNYIDLRNEVKFSKEIILKHCPDLRKNLAKGKYKFDKDRYTQYFFVVDGYDVDKNVLTLHAFEIVESPEEGHTATFNWFYVNLDTYEITDFFDEVLEKGESLSTKYPKYLTVEDFTIYANGKKISVNDDSKKIESILGKGKVTITKETVYNQGSFYYDYEKDGLDVTFIDGIFVDILSVESPKYATYRGLRVGDSYNKMIKLYGRGETFYKEGNQVIYRFEQKVESDDEDMYFDFFVTVDKSTDKVVNYYFGSTL